MKQLKLLLFACALLTFIGCKKEEPKKATAAYYFSAKLDGKDFLIQDGVDGYGSGAGAAGGGAAGSYSAEQSLSIINYPAKKSSGFVIVKNFPEAPTECSQIESMFHPGTYTYGKTSKGTNDPSTDGVVVFHVDANGGEWASDFGSADQTGSTFEIVEQTANKDGWSSGISKARFSCKLYDKQGNVKILTNGETKGRTVQCGNL